MYTFARLMWALLFIRSSAGVHRRGRVGGSYSYWWWDDWAWGWGSSGEGRSPGQGLDMVVVGVAAIGVLKCYHDVYRCADYCGCSAPLGACSHMWPLPILMLSQLVAPAPLESGCGIDWAASATRCWDTGLQQRIAVELDRWLMNRTMSEVRYI